MGGEPGASGRPAGTPPMLPLRRAGVTALLAVLPHVSQA